MSDPKDATTTTDEKAQGTDKKLGGKATAKAASKKTTSGAEQKGAKTHIVLLGGGMHGGGTLLMENFPPEKAIAALVEGERTGMRETDAKVICMGKLYFDPTDEAEEPGDKRVVVPSTALFASWRDGGRNVPITGKKNVSTASSTLLASRVHFAHDYIPLLVPDGEGGWRQALGKDAGEYFHTGKQGTGKVKTTVGIYRPGFPEWRLEIDVTLDLGFMIAIETYLKVVQTAGRDAGLLSFRPGCNGVFGTYVVDEFKVTNYVSVAKPRIIQLVPEDTRIRAEAAG